MVNNLFISLVMVVALMAGLELVLFIIFGKNRPTKLFQSAAFGFLVTAVSFSFVGQWGVNRLSRANPDFFGLSDSFDRQLFINKSESNEALEPHHLRNQQRRNPGLFGLTQGLRIQ